MPHARTTTKKITISGMVQGIGFRPHLYRLARELDLRGQVANSMAGVELILEGSPGAMADLMTSLKSRPPAGAIITALEEEEIPAGNYEDFTISASSHSGAATLLAPADFGMCLQCEQELGDPNDRRHNHAFISCTTCGPRFTIVRGLPYDRPQTAMADFPLCRRCQAEYSDPFSRRFHAEPICCPDCGPQLRLYYKNEIITDDCVARAAAILVDGGLVAIKGVGGFHLAADARNDQAIERLRAIKKRPAKPLALMVADLTSAAPLAHMAPRAQDLLSSPARPIVVMPVRQTAPLSARIAPNMGEIGIMLAYTPLHLLLFKHGPAALIMTSLNEPGSPMLTATAEARNHLGQEYDAILSHDRAIVARCDDSVIRMHDEQACLIRRSRGYTPLPLEMPLSGPATLACGAGEKVTFCLSRANTAFLSQHLGDTSSPASQDHYRQSCRHLQNLLGITPSLVAHDLHPDYFSSRFAARLDGCRKIAVQHHHAHIASCMADNQLAGPVLGLALDGTGLGDDGSLWGGEILRCTYENYQRLAHLSPLAMPGGEAAIKEPWRLALAWLHREEIPADGLAFTAAIPPQSRAMIRDMLARQLNTPLTTSLGRLFDAVAALINLRSQISFAAQAAMELEAISASSEEDSYPFTITTGDKSPQIMETGPLLHAVVDDLRNNIDQGIIAARFHNTVIRMLASATIELSRQEKILDIACSGGVFQNRIISLGLQKSLGAASIRVHVHRQAPCNDGGLALGQAAVAAARHQSEQDTTSAADRRHA